MNDLPPIMAAAFALLREDICEHLDSADALAMQDADWSADDIDTARELIGDLVLGIRSLMIEHESQGNARCGVCALPWPCPVTTAIHAFVTDPDGQFIEVASRSRSDA